MAKARKKPSARKLERRNSPDGQGRKRRLRGGREKNPAGDNTRQQKPETVAGYGTVIQSQASRLGVIFAWVVVALVALAAVVAVVLASRPTEAQSPAVDPGADETSQQAGEYARGFVSTWLRADSDSEEDLAAYQSASANDSNLSLRGTEPVEFRDLSVASVEEKDNGIMTVYVSADLEAQEVVEDGSEAEAASDNEDAETRTTWNTAWYQVNIFPQGDDFSVLGYPAPVAPPEAVEAPSLGYSDAAPTPIVSAVEDFFAAYLLEEGDVGRMIHPDSGIEPIANSPYGHVSVAGVSINEEIDDEMPDDGTQVKARAEIQIGEAEATRPATYSLTLQARGGRWEILTIDPTPELYVSDEGEMSTPTQNPGQQAPGNETDNGEQSPETETTDDATEEPDNSNE